MTQHLCPISSMVSAVFTSILARSAPSAPSARPRCPDFSRPNKSLSGTSCHAPWRSRAREAAMVIADHEHCADLPPDRLRRRREMDSFSISAANRIDRCVVLRRFSSPCAQLASLRACALAGQAGRLVTAFGSIFPARLHAAGCRSCGEPEAGVEEVDDVRPTIFLVIFLPHIFTRAWVAIERFCRSSASRWVMAPRRTPAPFRNWSSRLRSREAS